MLTFELVGLPGSGKTTVCRELLERTDDMEISFVSRHVKKLRDSILCKLCAPIAAVKFRRVFREIARGEERNALVSMLHDTAKILATHPERLRRSADTSIQVQLFLTEFLMERVLTRCDACITRTTFLYDEGYVQRALGLWLRTPASVRDRAWAAFLRSVPAGIQCIHVELPAEIALERSLQRVGGVPRSCTRLVGDPSDTDALLRVYRELGRLIHETGNHTPVEMSRLPGDSSPEHCAAELIARLREREPKRAIRMVVRTSRPPIGSASGSFGASEK